MIKGYPYTDFHELNLDYILDLAQRSLGLHLETSGDYLKLVNQAGETVSKVKVAYAERALQDTYGNDIGLYILNVGADNNHVIFTKGNGEVITFTVPYATKARNDKNGVDITTYVKEVGYEGKRLKITFGDGNTTLFRVPFATMAETDVNDKFITTYMADIIPNDNKLQLIDGNGVVLKEITVPYATKARNDVDGDPIKSNYGHALITGTTSVILQDKDGSTLSEITVPYSVKAVSDVNDNTLLGDYGYHLGVDGKKTTIEAHNGTVLNKITVPFATAAGTAEDGITSVSVVGDKLVFTKGDGSTIEITVPYSVKALKDDLNNTLSHTYIANIVNDPNSGKLSCYASDGTLIAELVPTISKAVYDSFNNRIADYIKSIVTDPNSDYVTVTHGTGTVDSLTINYSTKALKDTYGNVIGNTYIRSLEIETDPVTGLKVLVAYNGELSELFRIPLVATSAETDINGTPITDYVLDVTLGTNNESLDIKHGDNTVNNIPLPVGSNVEANVTDTPTVELDNIKIDGTVYNLVDTGDTVTVNGSGTPTAEFEKIQVNNGTVFGISKPWYDSDVMPTPENIQPNQGTVLSPVVTLPTNGVYIAIANTTWSGSNQNDCENSVGVKYTNSADNTDPENGMGLGTYYTTCYAKDRTVRLQHMRIINGKAGAVIQIQVRTDNANDGAVLSDIQVVRISAFNY